MLKTITKTKSLRMLMYTIFFLLVYQTLHMVDHVLQYTQTYMMGIADPPALFEGLLNASDTTIHLWLNTIEWGAMAVLWLAFRQSQVEQSISVRQYSKATALKILMGAIFFLLIFQTFHMIDHALQYMQFYMLKYAIDVGSPGLFQGLFSETDRIIHTWVNGILIMAIIVVWAAFRNCQVKRIISPIINENAKTG